MYIHGGSFFGPTKQVTIVKKEKDVIEGESIERLMANLNNLSKEEKKRLKESSLSIIKKCVDSEFSNNKRENNTGLIIGKIQSGKTLSFTSVLALARDNGFRIVIIISGRTNLLLKQTIDRLKKDLTNLDRNISVLTNAETKEKRDQSRKSIKRVLKNERTRKTIVIPVLKHQGRLAGLKDLFDSIEIGKLLQKKSVLIIDDEADQASLNTNARNNEKFGLNDESAIFASIKNLRFVLPNHSYLQYTATPQAPLLIDSLSLLSPDWHEILIPGSYYTGGQVFFDNNNDIVKNIVVEGDFPPNTDHLESAPKTLKSAVVEFLILTVLMGDYIEGKSKSYNNLASMLVHPTWKVNSRENSIGIDKFTDWIQNYVESLEEDIENSNYDDFEDEYQKTKKRLQGLNLFSIFPSLEQVIEAIENYVFDDLIVHQVTGGMLEKGEEFPWENNSFHILVGGQLLDRGFTVENLILTYMPRDSKGSNQSDTIEQRCRFYGYRKKYIDFCRVYITAGLKDDYFNYNDFEKELHSYLSKHSLEEFMETGSRMMMQSGLIPTNMSRISEKIVSNHLKGFQSFDPQFPYLESNDSLIDKFIYKISDSFEPKILKPKNEDHQTDNVTHKVIRVPTEQIINFLVDFQLNNKFEIIKMKTILRYLEQSISSEKYCWVIEIGYERDTARKRTIKYLKKPKNAKNQYFIPELAAGDTKFSNGEVYFGDRKLLVDTENQSSINFNYHDEVILQIHKINAGLKTKDTVPFKNETFSTLAFNFPDKLAKRYITKISNK